MNWKTISTAILAGSLLGCQSAPQRVETVPPPRIEVVYVRVECGEPPPIDPVHFRPVKWDLVSGNAGLSVSMYANLAENMAYIGKAIRQLQLRIAFYEACVSVANSNADP